MQQSLIYRSRITRVKFGVNGNEAILKESCSNITSYDLFHDNEPVAHGLYNAHLGTDNYKYTCMTCFNSKSKCLGHDGHHIMKYPVISPMFLNEIRKWLKLTCFECGKPIIEASQYKSVNRIKRLDYAQKIARTGSRKCVHCKAPHPIIKKDPSEPLAMIAEYFTDRRKTDEQILYPHIIKRIFQRISDTTVEELGKPAEAHPRKFILDVIKVPGVPTRPASDTTSRAQDTRDVNTMFQIIMKKNAAMNPVTPDVIDLKYKKSIYELCNSYYELIRASGEGAMNSYAAHLKGKGGYFRKNMMGKRVVVMARSTIVGDVTLPINCVGVPLKFAKTVQMEEYVQEYNKRLLTTYIANGLSKYPGCTEIVKRNTGRIRGVSDALDIELEPGDILYRDMIDGDPTNFNRQPSLKSSNISGMKMVVCEDPNVLTLRMNVISCPLFDADFDGDYYGSQKYICLRMC
jgi:DNA-directed RNA polymerase beta' subunit